MSQASFELRESRWSEGLDTYAPTIQAFADHLAGLDYRAYTVMRLASAARHFCVWLQLSKVAPDEIDDDVVTRFTRHRCCCLGRRRSAPRIAINFERRVRRFVRFLTKEPINRRRNAQNDDPRIDAYLTWIRVHRGLSESTMHNHVQVLRRVLPLLGHDPKEYDAQRVRDAVLEISRRYRRRRRATVHRQENGHPSRSAPHMRDAHPSSHRGCALGFALARPCQHPEHRNLPSSRSDREA